MTVPATDRIAGPFNGNDATTAFPFTNFKVLDQGLFEVYHVSAAGAETKLTISVDYTIVFNADQDAAPGGTITYPVSGDPLATGEQLYGKRVTSPLQEVDIITQGSWDPDVVETMVDRSRMREQELDEEMARTVKVSVSSGTDPDALVNSIFVAATAADASATAAGLSETAAGLSETNAAASAASINADKIATGGQFWCHEQLTPNMTVSVDAGNISTGTVLIAKTAQNSATIVAPSTNPRIDRIAIDITDGSVVVITGTEAASPVAPNYLTNHFPLAQILLQTTTTTITDLLITDERSSHVANKSTFANNSNGNPNISDTQLQIYTTVLEDTWESFGPTGSGKDNIWSVLDGIPEGVDWIELKIRIFGTESGGLPNQARIATLYARAGGSTELIGEDNGIAEARGNTNNTVGFGTAGNIVKAIIPVTNRTFDLYWETNWGTSTTIIAYLTGYGYN